MSQSSVRSIQEERGKPQHKHEETNENGADTLVVTDIDAENERLNRLHRFQTLVHSALCWPMDEVREVLAPREGVAVRVLSVTSGSGMWAAEMAKEFPHAEVLGIDKVPGRPSDTPPNCRYEVLDLVNDDISHLQGMFDVVHCSRGGGWVSQCRPFWARLAKLVKPGGLLLYVTCGTDIYDESKNIMKPAEVGQERGTGSWWARFWTEYITYAPIALDVDRAKFDDAVLDWLRGDPNLEDIKVTNVYLPMGWSGTSGDNLKNGEEIGQLLGINATEWGRLVKPMLLANGMPAELLDLCEREYEAEILDPGLKYYTLWPFYAARGRAR